VVAIVLIATTSSAGEVRRLRLCADPSNLPFSSRDAREPGFEVEIARAIAAALDAELTVHWVPTAREIVVLRQLDEGRCDLVMGFPITPGFVADKPGLSLSAPYYVMRQVVVASSVGGARSPEDLRARVVGVQAMTLGDQLVHERGFNRKVYVTPDATFDALVKGEVDAVVMESPLAGWFVTRNAGFVATAIDPARDLEIGAAVRKADGELRESVDRAIRHLAAGTLPGILGRYGVIPAQASPPAAPLSAELRAARSTFLTQCSQCHGTDAKGTAAASNLQVFKGSEADFVRTVQNGRPGTGMTPWKGLISEEDIRAIARYIKQLATDPARP
jgi:ABC-type amino acid transport substrate-binding protein